ncbi:MAG: phosphate ABC transporter permease PstA [Gemmatimonadetes bacterium]|nr:phosphate ABC transporter permease PstA [Gemmatimonadota bacterium]
MSTGLSARTSLRRRFVNGFMLSLTWIAAVLATLPLLFVLFYLLEKGVTSLNWAFFTHLPHPPSMPGGGAANAIVGTLVIVAGASVLGVPVGIGAGIYLAERKGAPLAVFVRFLADVLNGLPSIVMGIFAWELVVVPMGHFSALAGALALGAMMIPTVTRTTEEMVRVVPSPLREAALALGYTQWRTSLRIVLPTALAGILTGVLVALARIAGETAPLLFTAFGNDFWSLSMNQPIAALPLQIFNYAISPYDDWHAQAWAGALVLIALVLVISLLARAATRSGFARASE